MPAVQIDFHTCSFQFPDKPPAEVLTALKAHGFRWQPVSRTWTRFRGWGGLPAGFADWIANHANTTKDHTP